ncbi:mannose-1-phosphate guanylyltransferase [bacterium]|nr:mannose-1-phosphate guanylyltransferase [bacterium]
MLYAVIMAGGVGTRFWPRSRSISPKQLLNIFGEKSMIQHTVERIQPLVEANNIYVVTNIQQSATVARQLPQISRENILVEPVGRNTAPCIGLAALHIMEKDPDGVMAVLAADHLIKPVEAFCADIRFAEEIAVKTGASVTLGIIPTRPETGYGYIQYHDHESIGEDRKAFRVKAFAEKPNTDTAKRFISSGDFLWNSGMFIWKAATILKLIEEFLPELYEGLIEIKSALHHSHYDDVVNRVYRSVKGISIDYGVMEKTKDVYVIKSEFDWNDVGSWEEVYQLSKKDSSGNALTGDHVILDTTNSLVYSAEKTVAMVGVHDLIVVNTDDALLICRRDQAQDVKKIVDELQRQKRNELL